MYRYYQTGEKSVWRAIPDGPRVEQEAVAAGATKLSIFAVSEVVDDETVRSDLSHKGPLYFDIDNKDIGQAIDAAKMPGMSAASRLNSSAPPWSQSVTTAASTVCPSHRQAEESSQ